MNLSNFMLGEKSDMKDYIWFNYIKWPEKEICKKRRQGCWKWDWLQTGWKDFFGVMEIVLELDCGHGWTTVEMYYKLLNYTLKMSEFYGI